MQVAAFDVSKKELVYSVLGKAGKLVNQEAEIESLLSRFPSETLVAMEATNCFHLPLANMAYAKGFRVVVANPRRVKAFAKATAARGKSDKVDARSIEQYIQAQHEVLQNYVPRSEFAQKIQDLSRERQSLVEALSSLRQSLDGTTEAARRALVGLEEAIKIIDAELRIDLEGQEEYHLLLTIPGMGPTTTAGLLALLMSFDFVSADSFVAFLGMDPRPDDSGERTGRRKISSNGHALGRRLAYMAGLSGMRTQTWKPYAQKQRDKGLSGKETAIIVGRKIVRTAWSLHKHKTSFSQQRVGESIDNQT
jgi:transposase